MEASLTCAVCLGLFEEPVTLPLCSHNFCRHCVQGFTSSPPGPPQQLCCPLCRKVSSVPGGSDCLPVNTTLAEVVKILRASPGKEGEEVAGGAGSCLRHSGRQVQLYCRMCHEGVCGLCVSEHHQGPFHSINLMDVTYQEEKLTFFSILKKLREAGEKLTKEISDDPNYIETILEAGTEMITSKFDQIAKSLELKKKQMIEHFANQRSKKVKEHQLWRKMKDVDKRTVENFLEECGKIIDECDPQSFLKVACDLNKRMSTKLELMHASSSFVAAPQFKPCQMDITPALDAISAMKIMSEDYVRDPFSELQDSNGKFTFRNSTKSWKENGDVFDRFCEIRLKYYNNHRQVTNDVTIDSNPGSKKDAGILLERKRSPIPNIFEKKSTFINTKVTKKGRPKLIKQACFDESSDRNSSLVSLVKPPLSTSLSVMSSNIGESSQKVDGLSAPLQDSAQSSHLVSGSIFGETRSKSVTQSLDPAPQSLDPAPSDASPVKMPDKDVNYSLGTLSTLSFTAKPNDVTFNLGRETLSSTKEMNLNGSVLPNAHTDICRTHDKGTHFLEHLTRLSNSNSSSSAVDVTSANLVTSLTESAVEKPTFTFTFGNSMSSFPTFDTSKLGNPTPFSFSLAQPFKPAEESAKDKMRHETKDRTKKVVEEFSWLKLLASDSKIQNSSCSQSWTSFEGIAEMDAAVKKRLSISCNNIPSFSSTSCAMKPQYTSSFSFGCSSKNSSIPLSSTFLSLPSISETNLHGRGKEAVNSSSLLHPDDERSLPLHAAPVADLASNASLTLPSNLSKKPITPCIAAENKFVNSSTFIPMFSTMQSSLFASESSSISSHPPAALGIPQTEITGNENGTVSEISKLHNDAKISPPNQNTLDSVLQSQEDTLPHSACNSELAGISPNQETTDVTLPIKEDSDVDESNKDTSSSDCSSTSDESVRKRKDNVATDSLPVTFPLEDEQEDGNSSPVRL